jgi:hypothetical protein
MSRVLVNDVANPKWRKSLEQFDGSLQGWIAQRLRDIARHAGVHDCNERCAITADEHQNASSLRRGWERDLSEKWYLT